ncbi:MAG TPA: hypothetical protein VF765_08575 [Polyangiaceae bacterium]
MRASSANGHGACLLAVALLTMGCGGGGAPGAANDAGVTEAGDAGGVRDAGDAETGAPDGPMRPYRLGSGGVQLIVSGPDLGLQMTPANLATDVDVVDLHHEYYGVPWNEFAAGQAPPAVWKAKMDSIAQAARSTGKPVFLSVSMLDGARKTRAPQAVIQNGQIQQQPWATQCFDFANDPQGPASKQAYLAYVAWMIDEFAPTYLNVAVEVNLFFENCPASVAGAVDVANAAYDAAKAKNAALVVFPSIQIDHLYGYATASCPDASMRAQCFDANYAQIASLKRDRFAMSTYPFLPGVIEKPSALPSDWFSRGASRGHEHAVVAETGWNSTAIAAQTSGGSCVTVETSTEADEAAYLELVLADAKAMPMDLLDWWADRDLVAAQLMTDCPCTFDTTWCTVLGEISGSPVDGGYDSYFFGQLEVKAFGTMGLRDYAGNPKAMTFAAWQSARALPIAP